MKHENEAIELKTQLNQQFENIGIGNSVSYGTFLFWDSNYEKIYNVVFFPKIHEAKFLAANDSQKIAFKRVSIKAQLKSNDFLLDFETEKNLDSELSSYLNS